MTPEPARRADRALAAATAKRNSGALDAALSLLGSVTAGPPDGLRTAEAEQLRGLIAFDQGHARDASRILLDSARQLEPLDPDRARMAYLEAMSAAIWASGPEAPGVLALAAAAAPPPTDTPVDLLLQAFAHRVLHGYAAAAPELSKALAVAREAILNADDVSSWLWLAGNRASGIIALELWESDTALELAVQQDRMARESGALVQLQFALNFRANLQTLTGDLAAAAGCHPRVERGALVGKVSLLGRVEL